MRYLPLMLVLLLVGCARYEFDITSPPEFAGHIGSKDDYTFKRDPLEYRMRSADNRLVVRIYNPTDQPITLLGGHSAAVDPDGQSHPLRTQTIVPSSYIKQIIPPPRPQFYDPSPTIGFGVGTVITKCDAQVYDADDALVRDPYYREPRYLTVYDDNDTIYWEWKGESDVRLILVFQRGEKNFTHEFIIHRVKM